MLNRESLELQLGANFDKQGKFTSVVLKFAINLGNVCVFIAWEYTQSALTNLNKNGAKI
jgi:hypothetical protein